MTFDELRTVRSQITAESVTVGEFFRRYPTHGTVLFNLPDFADPTKYREGNQIGLYLYDEHSLTDGIASMFVKDITVTDGRFLTLYCKKEVQQ